MIEEFHEASAASLNKVQQTLKLIAYHGNIPWTCIHSTPWMIPKGLPHNPNALVSQEEFFEDKDM
eukprot:5339834-Pyramimonas_sp.AAC.3